MSDMSNKKIFLIIFQIFPLVISIFSGEAVAQSAINYKISDQLIEDRTIADKKKSRLLESSSFFTVNTELIQYYNSGKYFNTENLMYGFKVGSMKNTGFFVSIMSNFRFNGLFKEVKAYETAESKHTFSFFEGGFGLTGRYCKPLSFHFELGYFYRASLYNTLGKGWGYVNDESIHGPIIAAGFMFHIKGFVISAEAVTHCNTTTKEYKKAFGFGGKLGIGFCIPNKKGKQEERALINMEEKIKHFVPKTYIPDNLGELRARDTIVVVHINGNSAQQQEPATATFGEPAQSITDIDGNSYRTVQIGKQQWMADNLRVTSYNDGTAILLSDHVDSTNACRYYPNGAAANVEKFGYLYNWNALTHFSRDSSYTTLHSICPTGWHVPSVEEWNTLANYLHGNPEHWCGSNSEYVAKAVAANTDWYGDIGECTVGSFLANNNNTGFAALPAGYYNNTYSGFGSSTFFWSSTESGSNAHFMYLYNNSSKVGTTSNSKGFGLSVRCVKD